MGAWGHGNFDNDDALDWIYELQEALDTSAVVAALARVIDESADYLEAPECSSALAAAEVVAALNGKPASSLPEEVTTWIKGKAKPDSALLAKARRAVDTVLDDSELKDLWKVDEDLGAWGQTVEDLK
ncbi:MAG: DUF4259 domain-containing protein, partial [Rhodospirillales bacterium]|nr:DUF4259 domain-containing protein [Rhodospirillales bacterium]